MENIFIYIYIVMKIFLTIFHSDKMPDTRTTKVIILDLVQLYLLTGFVYLRLLVFSERRESFLILNALFNNSYNIKWDRVANT